MKEALMVIGNADNFQGTGDEVLNDFLFDDLEFVVTIADDDDDSGQFGRNIGLVVISSSANANALQDEYLNSSFPAIVMDDGGLEEMQMVEENDGDTENDQEIEFQDLNHPIAKALGLNEEEVEVYENNNDITFGQDPTNDADIIATNANGNDEATIFMYEAGSELAEDDNNNTRTARNRRCGFFVTEPALNDDDLNADGEALLEAAILYTWNGNGR
jgi:hypothetical protein